MALKYSKVQKRTIKICKRDALSAKVTAERINNLKSTKTNVTSQNMRYALKVCDSWQ